MNRFRVLLVVAVALVFVLGAGLAPHLSAQQPDVRFEPDPQALAALAAVFFVALLVLIAIGLAVAAVVCWLISGCLKVLPQEYREMEPGMVWLLMIPLFQLVWNFFVFPKTSRSFQRYFAARGRTEFGDCGEKIGLWYAICGALCLIPCVNYVAGPAALVLLIIYLVKVTGLKQFVTA